MKSLKNKKLLIGISSVFVIAILITVLLLTLSSDNEIFQANVKEKEVNQAGGFLTLMLETEAGSGEYQESTSGAWPGEGYIFNKELSSCQNGSELSWNEELGAVTLSTTITDSCYVYFDVYTPPTLADLCNGLTFSECITTQVYTGTDGENGLYFHDADLENGAGDNSYRYAGADPNNYVCFGSDAAACPSDNLYRIIGVFGDEVKLIKWDYANSDLLGTGGAYSSNTYSTSSYGNYDGVHSTVNRYYWTSSSNTSNVWRSSQLNTENLNNTFLNNFNSIWQNKISTHSWKVGGMTSSNGKSTAKTAYDYDVGSNSCQTTSTDCVYTTKVGLMYISDYGYAASPENWTTNLSDYNNDTNRNNNWMYFGIAEWTISRDSGPFYSAFIVGEDGNVTSYTVITTFAVRPVFYLNSSTQYSSGSGTKSDPIRLSISNNLISFNINGETYSAEEGMDWMQWSESDYNTLGIICSVGGSCVSSTGLSRLNILNGGLVNSSDVIIVDGEYVLSQAGGTN